MLVDCNLLCHSGFFSGHARPVLEDTFLATQLVFLPQGEVTGGIRRATSQQNKQKLIDRGAAVGATTERVLSVLWRE